MPVRLNNKKFLQFKYFSLFIDNVLNFKCPDDGLYKHPSDCNKFLQCVYFGTIYERYYVLDCPAGLFFNEKYSICDYTFNVICLTN